MLSITKCKQILNRPEMSDEEAERLRDSLYMLANGAFNTWRKCKACGSATGDDSLLSPPVTEFQACLPKSCSDDTSGHKKAGATAEGSATVSGDTVQN